MKLLLMLMVCFCLLPIAGCEKPKKGETEQFETESVHPTEGKMKLKIGNQTLNITLESNETAKAFSQICPCTLEMTELNGNEKYHYLMNGIPSDAERVGKIERGDLMLFGSDCVVLFYESFSTPYSYTRIGKVEDPDDLPTLLGSGSVTVTFE